MFHLLRIWDVTNPQARSVHFSEAAVTMFFSFSPPSSQGPFAPSIPRTNSGPPFFRFFVFRNVLLPFRHSVKPKHGTNRSVLAYQDETSRTDDGRKGKKGKLVSEIVARAFRKY